MKHRDLIVAAMDGKIIQYKFTDAAAGLKTNWMSLSSAASAVSLLVIYPDSYEYRIKPELVPDKVSFGVIANPEEFTESEVRSWKDFINGGKHSYTHLVKLTIKTDENGVETEHVEIVK